MTLTFTQSGLLTPAIGIEISLELSEEHFVRAFPGSATRKRLFENFQRYLGRFQDEIFPWFEMWVDGSFVTRKENPEDIDFVVFLDWEVYELRERTLDRFWGYNFENRVLDAYIVKVFSEDHPDYQQYLNRVVYWENLFVNKQGIEQKGFLKLNIGRKVE
jgi:deoxyadenosine/deoxycytidine kinase